MFELLFYQFCNKLVKIIKGFIGILFCLMLLTITFQIVARNIFYMSTPWTEEITVYLMTYITYVGGIAVIICGQHFAIDLLTERISETAKNWLQVVYLLLFLAVCTYLAINGARFCLDPLMRLQRSIATNIPRVYVYMVMPISMFASIIYCLFHLFFILRKLWGRHKQSVTRERGVGS